MVEQYCDGVVPAGARDDAGRRRCADLAQYHAAMDGSRGYLLHEALRHVWQSVARGNEYVRSAGAVEAREGPGASRRELEATLASLVRQLARQAVLLAPFMPAKAQELWAQLGAPGAVTDQRFAHPPDARRDGMAGAKGEPLFPKEKPAA